MIEEAEVRARGAEGGARRRDVVDVAVRASSARAVVLARVTAVADPSSAAASTYFRYPGSDPDPID